GPYPVPPIRHPARQGARSRSCRLLVEGRACEGARKMAAKELTESRSRLGRPSKFSEQTVQRLCAALADGMPIKGACVVAGIGVTTLSAWREKHPRLEDRMSEARELARENALRAIKAAGEKDWRAKAEWLRLVFAEDYRGGQKVEVQQAVQIQVTAEQIEDLRSRLPD